jgi:FkbM family methyltransferase
METESSSALTVEIAGHSARFDFNHSRKSHIAIIEELVIHHRPYEHETIRLMLNHLQIGDTFIDVGAHIGWFSVWASRFVGATGKVYAVEPEESNYELLNKTILTNDCRNVVTHRSAAAAHDGETVFYINQDNDGGHSLWNCGLHEFNHKTREQPTSVLVPCTTLDSFCLSRKILPIRMIKIDTEGAEVSVLRGASELLSMAAIDYVICEVHSSGLELMGSSAAELKNYMESKAYRIVHVDQEEEGCVFNVMFAREGM